MKSKVSSLQAVEIRKIGQNKGHPRLWIDGDQAIRAGFLPGMQICATVDEEKCMLKIELKEDGDRKVSKKIVRDREVPVIDINHESLLGVFVKMGLTAVRIVVQLRRIFVLPIASEVRAKERIDRLKSKLERNEPLLVGSFSSGIGILDRAAHEGLESAGVSSRLALANEIREDCMQHAVQFNPVFDAQTILLTVPMQEAVFDQYVMSQLPKLDGLVIGIPCSGASTAGRTKLKLKFPEEHPEVGHLVVPFLAAVAQLSPSFVAIECVPNWLNTASAAIARSMLRDLGYVVHETVLNAADWNMLEHRERMCIVAVTQGIEFSFDLVDRPEPMTPKLGDVMDTVPSDHKCWSPMQYLKDKQERDEEEGKGFKMTIVNEHSSKVPTLNATLHKRQSTGTFFQHPTNPDLLRIPTVHEHARCKGIWEDLLEGVTQTFGHETCGQSVSVPPFVAVFNALGRALRAFKEAASISFTSFARAEKVAA